MTDPTGHTPSPAAPTHDDKLDGAAPSEQAVAPSPAPSHNPVFATADEAPPRGAGVASPSLGAADDAPAAETTEEPLPDSFVDFGLPAALTHAVAQLGWTKPTPVQAKTFAPMVEGRDLLVQSRTGSGKTGAFCLPWLANRFHPAPARETGVQLLVMLPTRELAKQVCDELTRLALESPVDVLAVYGGTAMGPQLDALRAGVHAVVGTPGRILDHVRRRSLDLSKVRTVVLDECDEMLSMGFLEDIRAILDACPKERQTCLFSATLPQDIVRIANRSMRDPVRIELSTGGVSASEIEHCAYVLSGTSLKTHDLVDVLIEEDPAVAIIFCNTREETRFVAGVLQREGWPAEALSSDLTQAAREKVLQQMRDHELRFLVATDVAARGIDISHVSHVINYSFPETPESYVHRTGRTGRAGRRGVAISLIGPAEIGNFYTLRRQYPSIQMGERQLPSPEELAARRRETKIDKLSQRFPELVSPDWTQLARWLAADPRGERIIAFLLSEAAAQPRPARSVADESDSAERDAGRPPRDRDRERDRRRREDDEDYRSPRGRGRDRRDDRREPRRDQHDRRPAPAEGRTGRPSPGPGPGSGPGPRHGSTDRTEHAGRPSNRPHAADEQTPELADTTPAHAPVAREAASNRRPPRTLLEREVASEERPFAASPAADELRHVDNAREVADDEADDIDVDEGAGEDAGAEAEGTGEAGATPGKRKRRRRRKRKTAAAGAAESAATGPEDVTASTASDASTAMEAEGADADDADEDDADETLETETETGTTASGGAGGKKRRRRRRKKKPAQDAASAATPAASSAPPDRHIIDPAPVFQVVSQEEIILDIDEAELAEVRETFGEVDELDDLTLKARRRGVLDELQEEVVFEDLSDADAAHAKRVAEADAAREDAEGDDEGDDEDEGAPTEDGAAASATAGAEDGRKKKKRRRRKKKAPYVMPELVAPPHKDFWEVWAAKFTREDFNDERFPLPADPEPPPAASRSNGRGHDRASAREDRSDRGERSDRPSERESVVGGEGPVDDRDYVRVELNVGREHGRKSAEIRGLLADLAGLRGRLVRDLTVADRASYFRMPRELLDSAGKRLDGARDGETELRLVEAPDAPVVLRVNVPSPEAPAAPVEASPPAGDGTLAADAGGASATASEPVVDVVAAVPVAPAILEEPPPAS